MDLEMLPMPRLRIRPHTGTSVAPRGPWPTTEGPFTYSLDGFKYEMEHRIVEPEVLFQRMQRAIDEGKLVSKSWVAAQLSFYQIPCEYAAETGKQLQAELIDAINRGECDTIPAETRAIEERLKLAYIPLHNDHVRRRLAWEEREIRGGARVYEDDDSDDYSDDDFSPLRRAANGRFC
ncbi:hypothetical protein LTR27_000528 [Elasticomyces elasticus]|nr:hypothetical protein LTR27_000528 [Elasticomyces elasticus]